MGASLYRLDALKRPDGLDIFQLRGVSILKRDLDLIRDILLTAEKAKPEQSISIDQFREGYPDRLEEISAHVELLDRVGFLDATITKELSTRGPRQFFINKIEWSGYDYLDAVRDPGVWSKTQQKLKSVGGSATLEIAKAVAIKIVTDNLRL